MGLASSLPASAALMPSRVVHNRNCPPHERKVDEELETRLFESLVVYAVLNCPIDNHTDEYFCCCATIRAEVAAPEAESIKITFLCAWEYHVLACPALYAYDGGPAAVQSLRAATGKTPRIIAREFLNSLPWKLVLIRRDGEPRGDTPTLEAMEDVWKRRVMQWHRAFGDDIETVRTLWLAAAYPALRSAPSEPKATDFGLIKESRQDGTSIYYNQVRFGPSDHCCKAVFRPRLTVKEDGGQIDRVRNTFVTLEKCHASCLIPDMWFIAAASRIGPLLKKPLWKWLKWVSAVDGGDLDEDEDGAGSSKK